MIKHKYERSAITPGLCGAGGNLSPGHIRCCGKPESHETHNQAHCQDCKHHFTPDDQPLCPRCEVYVPEAFEVIMRRQHLSLARAVRTAILTVIDDGCQKHWKQPWLLDADDEALANDERLRFCDAVQAQIDKTNTQARKAA